MNEFEKKLQQQKIRTVPDDWRAAILGSHKSGAAEKRSFLTALNEQINAILWPHPKAWAGIAAVWVLIFAANRATDGETPRFSRETQTASEEYWRGLREREQFLTQLIDPKPRITSADRPRVAPPRPRSANVLNTATV